MYSTSSRPFKSALRFGMFLQCVPVVGIQICRGRIPLLVVGSWWAIAFVTGQNTSAHLRGEKNDWGLTVCPWPGLPPIYLKAFWKENHKNTNFSCWDPRSVQTWKMNMNIYIYSDSPLNTCDWYHSRTWSLRCLEAQLLSYSATPFPSGLNRKTPPGQVGQVSKLHQGHQGHQAGLSHILQWNMFSTARTWRSSRRVDPQLPETAEPTSP